MIPIKPHLRTITGQIYEHHVKNFMSSSIIHHHHHHHHHEDDQQELEAEGGGLGFSQVFHKGLSSSRDGGIDISGIWPTLAHPNLRVHAQCKDSRAQLDFVRQLEATLIVTPPNSNSPPILGILFASRGFTKPALERAQSSSLPILLIHLLSPRLHPVAFNDRFALKGAYPNTLAASLLEPIRFVPAYEPGIDGEPVRKLMLWNQADNCPWKG